MPSLPVVTWSELVRALSFAGYEEKRQNGSHIILTKDSHPYPASVPKHPEIARGTLLRILRDAGIEKDEFLELLKK